MTLEAWVFVIQTPIMVGAVVYLMAILWADSRHKGPWRWKWWP